MSSGDTTPSLPAAVLFDMDGTLTEPMLDFPRIKAEMGIGDRPILEALAEMNPGERLAAEAVLHRHEEEAARGSTLNPGCRELLDWLGARGVGKALITRNSRRSVETVLERHGLRIDVLVAREDAPPKPDPTPLRLACDRLGVCGAAAWMVGDGQYDVEAGNAAGLRTVWVSHRRRKPFDAPPWRNVVDLVELTELLKSCCD
jgi:HAD superfamily hydrolase (TIGR01509 family)